MVWSNVNHFPVQQPAATNSMHLQSIHSPHWPYIPVFRFLWGPTRVRVRVFRYAVPLMSYVLIVILFVKQNIFILHCSNLTPVRQKQAICEIILIFSFCVFITDFLVLKVLYKRKLSTKGATEGVYLVGHVLAN